MRFRKVGARVITDEAKGDGKVCRAIGVKVWVYRGQIHDVGGRGTTL